MRGTPYGIIIVILIGYTIIAYSYIRDNMQPDLKLYTWIGMKHKNLVPNIQSIKSVAFFWFSGWPMVRWKDRRGPDPHISIRQLLWTEIITSEHACTFKHCSFKTTLVSHVLKEALVEIDEICMAGGGGERGVAPLLQKRNFCEPKKRANNFRKLTPFVSLWTNQVSLTIIDVMLIGCKT